MSASLECPACGECTKVDGDREAWGKAIGGAAVDALVMGLDGRAIPREAMSLFVCPCGEALWLELPDKELRFGDEGGGRWYHAWRTIALPGGAALDLPAPLLRPIAGDGDLVVVAERSYEVGADGWLYCREHNCTFNVDGAHCHCLLDGEALRRAMNERREVKP